MNTFGERLKHYRLAANLTQEALAKKCGMKKQSISRYENSDREPNIYIAKAIAEALGVSLESLIGEENSSKSKDTLKNFNLQTFAEPAPAQEDDAELMEYLEYLRTRPEARILMSTLRGATKEEVEENVRFIEALRKTRHGTD